MKGVLVQIFVLLSLSSFSQSIVNTEKALPSNTNGIHLSTNLSGTSTRGNVDLTLLNADAHLGIKVDSTNLVRVMGGVNVLQNGTQLTNNIGFLQIRFNKDLTRGIKTFKFTQLQYNNILLLEKRWLLGGGFRFELIPDSSRFKAAFLLGAMWENEWLNPEMLDPGEVQETRFTRTATSFSLRYKTEKLTIISTTYYQARLKDFKDFRLLNDTEIALKVNKHLSVFNVFEYRYDSKPPNRLNPYDYTSSLGITINI